MDQQSAISAHGRGSISIVIPCFNESKRLNTSAFRQFLEAHSQFRFIFVDDGSTDTTFGVLKNMSNFLEDRVRVVKLERNVGKAEAVRLGILQSVELGTSKVIGFWDADLATPLEALPDLVSVLTDSPGIEIIFGARVQLLGRQVHRKAIRHYLGRVFATITSLLLDMPFYDTQCGAKLFKITPATKAIFSGPFVSKWVFDVEIIARYLAYYDFDRGRLATTIFEYPLKKWTDVDGSKVRPLDFLLAIRDLWRIKRAYLTTRSAENIAHNLGSPGDVSACVDDSAAKSLDLGTTPSESIVAQKKSATY